tara:strand:+ start:110 stop:259 length:150 start_codon:yes stop_codon:yes gene_type:complete
MTEAYQNKIFSFGRWGIAMKGDMEDELLSLVSMLTVIVIITFLVHIVIT